MSKVAMTSTCTLTVRKTSLKGWLRTRWMTGMGQRMMTEVTAGVEAMMKMKLYVLHFRLHVHSIDLAEPRFKEPRETVQLCLSPSLAFIVPRPAAVTIPLTLLQDPSPNWKCCTDENSKLQTNFNPSPSPA